MIKLARTQGKLFFRDLDGIDVGIRYYIYYHSQGILFYYENSSESYVLNEIVEFNLWNCYIEGVTGGELRIELEPGEGNLLNIIKHSASENFQAKIIRNEFEVTKVI